MNKSTYVRGEHIWFKGYMYNRLKAEPFKESVNVYVGIYDKDGNQKEKHLVLSKEGQLQGQIAIDSSFVDGQYYIKASTSWMKDLKEDDSFVQQFTVLNSELVLESNNPSEDYDIQFFPESGHWVSNVQSVLGIKMTDENGNAGANMVGIIRNQIGEEIVRFRTNQLGFAKVVMTPSASERYWATVSNPNSKEWRVPLPAIDSLGLVLSTRNISEDRILVLVGTNAETKREIGSKPYSILIHRDGLLKSLDVVFKENQLYASHILDKRELHPGMNILTLIDNRGVPIAERLFFNDKQIKSLSLDANVQKVDKDSMEVVLTGFEKRTTSFASISVLPVGTKAYNFNSNILSSFLLKPYVRGYIEEADQYFTDFSKRAMEDLDMLLLTQGWSKYDWDNIFNEPPQKKIQYRAGIDVFGSINSKVPKSTDLLVYAGNQSEPTVIPLSEQSEAFSLDNYFVEQGEEMRLTLLNKRGELTMPNLFLRLDTGQSTDRIYELEPFRGIEKGVLVDGLGEVELQNFILPEQNTISLEEVVVSENRAIKRITTPFVSEGNLKVVTEETEGLYPRLLDIIRSSGFNVWEIPNSGYDRIRITTKRVLSFSLVQPSPILYIDDVRYPDFDILLDFPTTRVKSYYIDRTGAMEAGGAGGVIRVYTRKEGDVGAGHSDKFTPDERFFTHRVSNGFMPAKQYYTPKYNNLSSESFRYFGSIGWFPNPAINKNGMCTLKIPDYGYDEIVLFVEGMDEEGRLTSSVERVSVSSAAQ
ncbi:MAG: Plug domain-containing protein [Allomuricauda sp.]